MTAGAGRAYLMGMVRSAVISVMIGLSMAGLASAVIRGISLIEGKLRWALLEDQRIQNPRHPCGVNHVAHQAQIVCRDASRVRVSACISDVRIMAGAAVNCNARPTVHNHMVANSAFC